MTQVNMLEAKTKLSKLVEAVETGREQEIVLARNGRPVARIVPLEAPPIDTSKRLGIAEGEYEFDYEAFQALDKVIAKDFYDTPLFPEPAPARAKRTKKLA